MNIVFSDCDVAHLRSRIHGGGRLRRDRAVNATFGGSPPCDSRDGAGGAHQASKCVLRCTDHRSAAPFRVGDRMAETPFSKL